MQNITAEASSVKDAVSVLRRAMKQLPADEYLEAMAKIWITLDLSQKVDLIEQAIRASQLNLAIAHLAGTRTGRLRVKQVKENAENVADDNS